MAMDDEPTVRLPRARTPAAPTPAPTPAQIPPPATRGRRTLLLAGGAGLAAVAGGLGGWWALAPAPAPAPEPQRPPPQPRPVVFAPPLLDTQGLLAHVARVPTVLRWSFNPLVWMLDFPSLESQGRALNRAAALLEKAGTPRDRVLDDAALAAAIAADRRTAENWYLGHNYRGSELRRMATLAARDGVALNPLEAWVVEQAELARLVEPSRDCAILSVPATGAHVDAGMRAAILRHELGHGQFFTLPLFAAHVTRVWSQGFTDGDRRDMRRFLAAEGYDPELEEVMANEAMAYLIYTDDRRFFDPSRDLGWSDARADRLRGLLRQGAPPEP